MQFEDVGPTLSNRHSARDRDELAALGDAVGEKPRFRELEHRLEHLVLLHDERFNAPHDGKPSRDVDLGCDRIDSRGGAKCRNVPSGVTRRRSRDDRAGHFAG